MTKTIRCAIYTRKSTEDGLEQDFNSLDAQREAGLAYIKSQRHEGWRAIKKIYDDGGISGATLKRLAIQDLLRDIKNGQIDTVVVYKVDRLTRSLADFSKLIELFDQHNVSFISVTQQFNTTSSMGRLTLNVLLSFAQFEREITGERIRDKITASKKKGMWMGGLPPIGYDINDKKLVINKREAKEVQQIFGLYLKLGNVRLLKLECDRLQLLTKTRSYRDKKTGGTCFSRGHLYSLLHNPLYAGKVKCKDTLYEGQHEGIIEHSIWERVKEKLEEGAINRSFQHNQKQINLLTGLAFDESGNLLKPNYTIKQGKRYRYYVSDNNHGWRIPAPTLEQAVENTIIDWLKDEQEIYAQFEPLLNDQYHSYDTIKKASEKLSGKLSTSSLPEKEQIFKEIIKRVVIKKNKLSVSLNEKEIHELLKVPLSESSLDEMTEIVIISSHQIKRRGVEKKIILSGNKKTNKDENLIALIARSYKWLQDFKNGNVKTISEIAILEKMDDGDVSRFFQFAFLAPVIVTSIFEGKQPVDLTVEKLKRLGTLPLSWVEQKSRLGY